MACRRPLLVSGSPVTCLAHLERTLAGLLRSLGPGRFSQVSGARHLSHILLPVQSGLKPTLFATESFACGITGCSGSRRERSPTTDTRPDARAQISLGAHKSTKSSLSPAPHPIYSLSHTYMYICATFMNMIFPLLISGEEFTSTKVEAA